MSPWRSQQFLQFARETGANSILVANVIATAELTIAVNPALTPVFTLRHLAHLAGVDYGVLRTIITRANNDPYRVFRIRKRASYEGEKRFRIIAVPDPSLLRVQQWITQRILSHARPHIASVAYSKKDTLLAAAEPHCGCRWLIKLDVRSFFESINEISVYRVFKSLGYQPLIAFEMSRLCTRLGTRTLRRSTERWQSHKQSWPTISAYSKWYMGHLPQGAPSSPMLANLAVRDFDQAVTDTAQKFGLAYTRYADDLTLSTADENFSRDRCREVIGEVYTAMGRAGLSPNVTKTQIRPPGSRKIVLGLLVDGRNPGLTRDFKTKMRQHIHFLSRTDVGPNKHARARGFASVVGLKHHIWGLVSFARQIEPNYGALLAQSLSNVDWPL
jgi:RNA-directed DNA polymerase